MRRKTLKIFVTELQQILDDNEKICNEKCCYVCEGLCYMITFDKVIELVNTYKNYKNKVK